MDDFFYLIFILNSLCDLTASVKEKGVIFVKIFMLLI